MSARTKKRAEKARQRQPGSDHPKPSEGMSMAVDSQYGDTPPKSKSAWQPIGDLAARFVAKEREARDD